VTGAELLVDGFGRIREGVATVLDGLSPEQLAFRVDGRANSIGWLVWHLTRVQDDHIADAAGSAQVWTTDGWFERFGLPFEVGAIGYGHTSDEVAAVRVESPQLLADYHDAVHARTVAWVRALTEPDFERVVDTRWDPPVTLAVRLVSVLVDDLEHVGQAAFVRGLLP
jgi:uncharacterized damage-inducible protein DinB